MDPAQRPLSPFMMYRWQITNSLSILHRATGVFLALGALVLVCWLVALASGPETYERVFAFYSGSWFKLPLMAWAFCFFYHLANGVRHLFWDVGLGFEPAQIYVGGYLVVAFAVVATAAVSFLAII